MNHASKIFVAGHRGMVGSALLRCLNAQGYAYLLTPSRAELDLLDQQAVHAYLLKERPDYIAKTGLDTKNNIARAREGDGRG